MAAITPVPSGTPLLESPTLHRYSGSGSANQSDTLTSPVVPQGGAQRLCYAACTYSAAPTQTGVIFEIDSGLGANFDLTLSTGAANLQDTFYLPDGDLWLLPGDAIRVTSPAAGGAVTGHIVIVLEQA